MSGLAIGKRISELERTIVIFKMQRDEKIQQLAEEIEAHAVTRSKLTQAEFLIEHLSRK